MNKLFFNMTLAIAMGMVSVFSAGESRADLLAYWNQNSNDLPGGGFGFLADPDAFPQAADSGVAGATLSVGGGLLTDTITNANGDLVYQWVQSFGGTVENALFGDASGGSISIQGGTDTLNNGGYLQFEFDMSGYQDLVVSYATRGTGSGFTTQTWSWSTDGSSFQDFEVFSGVNSSTFSTLTTTTLSDLNNTSTAFLRVTFEGATGSTGNNRLDNIQFNATAIPEPSALAALGAMSCLLVGAGRRRR